MRTAPIRLWFSTLLILAGLALAADVILTLVWQEPVTAAIALVRRTDVDQRWAHGIPLDGVDRAELAAIRGMDARLGFLAAREARTAPDGSALGTLKIPAIGLDTELVQGATAASLQLGPGHYHETGLPGEGGTVAIAGHRTTYLAPFRDLDELTPGDEIELAMPYGLFTYAVEKLEVVAPDSWWITDDVGVDRLVLSTCNPLFSAAQRLVVFAALSGVTPRGPAVRFAARPSALPTASARSRTAIRSDR